MTDRSRPLRVCNVITGLHVGGAETMLHKLVRATESMGVSNTVVSLTESGPVGERLAASGVTVLALHGRRGSPDPRLVLRLRSILREQKPGLVHTWMYHANVVGGLAARMAGTRAVLWNVRASTLQRGREKRATIALARLAGIAAPALCSRVVINSNEGRAVHERLGYPSRMLEVIPNGFDLDELSADAVGRERIRREHSIPPGAAVVGMVGRYHPAKDHPTFLAAAARVAAVRPDAHFVLAGDGVDHANRQLSGQVDRAGLTGRVHLLGRREDLCAVYSALDVMTLSSVYEGFPNVLGEAMACEVPCVSTDVGDAREIVGDTGRVVPARDPERLAAECLALLAQGHDQLRAAGRRARQRITERYSLAAIAARYVATYQRITQ